MLRLILQLLILAAHALAVNNGLARLPPMGWNNWNAFACDVSSKLILSTAERLVSTGLRDLGYNYVVLDDCWSAGRDANGDLQADQERFPEGMKWLSQQVHGLGLKFGMYATAGEFTCASFEGSLDHEVEDARKFAEWEVDYLKYDNCFNRGRSGTPKITFDRFDAMWRAINATGRPMLYALCSWGEDFVWTWASQISNAYRISGDIYDSFSKPDDLCACETASDPWCISPGKHCSVLNILNKIAPYADRGIPGAWPDLDMLEVGNGGMSDDEYKAHFTLWALTGSILLMGNNLLRPHLPATALTILNNPAIIAISQDPLAKPGIRRQRNLDVVVDKHDFGETQIWSRKLWGGDWAIVFVNAAGADLTMSIEMWEVFYRETGRAEEVDRRWELFDLWGGRMKEEVAAKILDAPSDEGVTLLNEIGWYNSSEKSYEKGIMDGDERLLGTSVRILEPREKITCFVKAHSLAAFRMRDPIKTTKNSGQARNEL